MNEKLFLESFGIYITSSYSPLRYVYHIIKAFPTSTDFENANDICSDFWGQTRLVLAYFSF